MATPSPVTFSTASDVQWASGQNFNGYLLLILALPGSYTSAYLKGTQQFQIPPRTRIPIVDGELQGERAQVWKTSDLTPANCIMCAYWFDDANELISAGESLFTLTADKVITVPTLTAPTAAASCPSITIVAAADPTISMYPVVETPSGTINGSNKVFTLANIPLFLLGFYINGALMTEGTDFTISDDTITLDAAVPAPVTGFVLRAVYWA